MACTLANQGREETPGPLEITGMDGRSEDQGRWRPTWSNETDADKPGTEVRPPYRTSSPLLLALQGPHVNCPCEHWPVPSFLTWSCTHVPTTNIVTNKPTAGYGCKKELRFRKKIKKKKERKICYNIIMASAPALDHSMVDPRHWQFWDNLSVIIFNRSNNNELAPE